MSTILKNALVAGLVESAIESVREGAATPSGWAISASEKSAAGALSWLLKKQVRLVALILSIAVLGILSTQRVARAADKYWIDQEVDCNDFCSSDSSMHFACAVGYNFSGSCVLPADGDYYGRCRLVGYCYNKEEDEKDRQACDERRRQAYEDCASNGVKDFWCSNADVWGYECNVE